jgi:hypothetical protein
LLSLGVLIFVFLTPARGQMQQPSASAAAAPTPAGAQQGGAQQGGAQQVGSITGTVVDQSGAIVAGARVTLTREDATQKIEAVTDENGQFLFARVVPGAFTLTVAAPNLTTQTISGTLHSGENYVTPQISLAVAAAFTQVTVRPQVEIAEAQIKEQEQQRIFAVIPNFYVSYVPHAVSLTPKQKFELAWKTSIDPFTLGLNGAIAGVQQATNQFGGYGQGAEGYGKRFGASYGDFLTSTWIGGAILPSLFKQDPRYFYKGTGSRRSRILYAVAMSVMCKGDNGHWQVNYSGILGSFAAGGISNLYYPPNDRNGASLVFENTAIGIGQTAAVNLFQEFVIRKLTPSVANRKAKNQPPSS